MKIGFIGLGKMGSRKALKLLSDGHDVVVWNRSKEPVESITYQVASIKKEEQLFTAKDIQELVTSLKTPRIVWSMLPAGDTTEQMLQEISQYVEPGDIVIDGGNAHFSDTQRRYEAFQKKGIRFLGIGVSGGIIAEKNGYPLMVGGDQSAFKYIKPLLESLAKPNGGFDYFGEGGAGHYVKMVHNAIEYGMMQSFGEGFDVLKQSSYGFNLEKIGKVWQKGSIVSSFLLDRAVDALEKDASLSDVSGVIPRGGEGDWTVAVAKENNLPIHVIETSVEYRKKSESDEDIQNSYTAKMINALRREFGGHPVEKK
ncbi:MAG TPA: decarboxylating 6-phosphogluconate dehydrogenase [Candidatus Saccharimonadales bacterium]|nr:decarboxylating 6-phosphogluconate dehydrogenase [Candidatus Saccharimonadales bacterium]